MKKYLFLAAAAMTMVACSNDESTNANEPVEANFFASIDMQTRAYDASWDNGDEIGITGSGVGSDGTTQTISNVCYTSADGGGIFTVKNIDDKIYFTTDGDYTFSAYYPWNATTTIAASTTEPNVSDAQKKYDFLYASGATSNRDKKSVAFSFKHVMSKLVINVISGDEGITEEEAKKATLTMGNVILDGTFDGVNGTTTTTGTTSDLALGTGGTYSMILFPQSFTEGIKITASNVAGLDKGKTISGVISLANANSKLTDATAKAAGNALVAGVQYNITVSLNKSALVVLGCTISDWTEATQADPVPLY